jgi:choline dehydrogenase-like flavoprotein
VNKNSKRKFDYIVVGSGAGGSAIFNELVLQNKEVLLIEEGNDFSNQISNQKNRIANSLLEKYRNGGVTPVLGNPSFTFSEGVGLGGSTEINGALFWRTPSHILSEWIEKYRLDSLGDIHEHFEYYERVLGMSNSQDNFGTEQNLVSKKIKEACNKLNWKVEPARRIAPRCIGLNYCATGCPNSSKNSMSVTLIPRAKSLGGEVQTNFRVSKFEYRNNLVTGVTGFNYNYGRMETIGCKNLILSAGALGTPEIVHRSSNKLFSKNQIGFHINTKIVSEYPEKVFSNRGTIFTEQVQEFLEDGFIFMTSNFQPEYLALNLGSLEREETERVFNCIDNIAIVTVQIKPNGYGVQLHHKNTSSKFFIMQESDKDLLRHSMLKAVEAIFLSGASRILLPFDSRFIESLEKAQEAIIGSSIEDWQLSSVHAMSTLPMRANKSSKNVDEDGMLIDFKNLRVLDASILPTTLGESPQETIMAVVRNIAQRF